MNANFKTCMFGGFAREDVINYIEKSAREVQERIDALEKENADLTGSNEQLAQELRTLRTQVQVRESDTQELETLRQQLDEAQSRAAELVSENRQLTAQNNSLRTAAEECARLKERIADIEINAHRRTEEFRAEAITALRQTIDAQRAWCREKQEQYAQLNEGILQELHRAAQVVEDNDMSGFDAMLESLQQLEEQLQ